MRATFQNSGMVLSIGIFFSLMIAGLASTLPATMFRGLTAQRRVGNRRPTWRTCRRSAACSRRSSATTRCTTLLGPTMHTLSASQAAFLSGQTFFPNLISNPFIVGMHITFAFSIAVLFGAIASWLREPGSRTDTPFRVVGRADALSPPVS